MGIPYSKLGISKISLGYNASDLFYSASILKRQFSRSQIACVQQQSFQQLLNSRADLYKRTSLNLIELRSIHREHEAFIPHSLTLIIRILKFRIRRSAATVFVKPSLAQLYFRWSLINWVWRLTTNSKTDQTAAHCSYLLVLVVHSQEPLEDRVVAYIGSRSFHHFPILIWGLHMLKSIQHDREVEVLLQTIPIK